MANKKEIPEERRESARRHPVNEKLAAMAEAVTRWAGSSWGFSSALAVVLIWAATGPIFKWSNTWQLVINSCTTIVTFLMVFLIQRSQNKDGMATQLKLNELVASIQGASNRLIDVEDLTEEELKTLHHHYQKLVEMAREDQDVTSSHSVEEAEQRHSAKRSGRRR